MVNNALVAETVDFLKELIRKQSLGGQEEEAIQFAHRAFKPLADEAEMVELPIDLKNDPDYSTPIPDINYKDRHNLRVVVKGAGSGRSLLFNTHVDVVPASESKEKEFDPYVKDGSIFGRGACDAKGQIATLFLLLKMLKNESIELKGDVILNIVVEEENGGNGSLAAVRRGESADAAIVMEPSKMNIFSSVRGAIWFKVICTGKSGHSGSAGKRISALDLAIEAKDILKNYHAKLLKESKGIPLFDTFENPMPITFGKLIAGSWPATIPHQAVLEGVLGILPNKTRFEVMKEIEAEIKAYGNDNLKENFEIEFMYKHDSHVLNTDHPLVGTVKNACEQLNIKTEVTAMVASCDSWLYNNQLNIPTIVFGPGDLGVAHSNNEHIKIEDIKTGAEVLKKVLIDWCRI